MGTSSQRNDGEGLERRRTGNKQILVQVLNIGICKGC